MSSGLKRLDICVRKGSSVRLPVRIETDVLTWAPISAIAQSAPAVITATGHGCPDGWRAAVVGAKGMTKINASLPLRTRDLLRVTVVDANTVNFNRVDSSGYRAYTSSGSLVFYQPIDLSQYTSARLEVKDRVGGTQIVLLNTSNAGLEIDSANDTLWVVMSAAETAAITADSGVFDIELVAGSGAVKAVCSADSVFTFEDEVTTDAG